MRKLLLWALVIAIAITTRLVEARLLRLRSRTASSQAADALQGIQETPLDGVLLAQSALSKSLSRSRRALDSGDYALAASAAFEAQTLAPQNGEAWLLLCRALRELGKGSIQADSTRVWRESALRIADLGRGAAPGVNRELDALAAELLLESYVWGSAVRGPGMPEQHRTPLALAIAGLERACEADPPASRRFLYAKALLWALAHPEVAADCSVEDLKLRYQLQRRTLTIQRDAWRHRIEALERELPPP
jgi:tetratricopeptide (TPR) repeat protein